MIMRASVAVLALAARHAAAQSAEPSPYDTLVADTGCTTEITVDSDREINTLQITATSATVSVSNAGGGVKQIYLTNQDGTVFGHSTGSTTATFDWAESSWDATTYPYPGTPAYLKGMVLFEDCVMGKQDALRPTWATIMENYITSDAPTFDAAGPPAPPSLPPAPPSPPPAADEAAAAAAPNPDAPVFGTVDFVNNDVPVTFKRVASVKMEYVKDAKGLLVHLLDHRETPSVGEATVEASFPAGTTSLTACEASAYSVLCTDFNLVPPYIANLESGTTTATLAVTVTRPYGNDIVRLVPTDSSCVDYTIYAKLTTDATDAIAFGADAYLEFKADEATLLGTTFYAYVKCDAGDLSYGQVDVATDVEAISSLSTDCIEGIGKDCETVVGYADCAPEHAEGTSFDLDGKNCTCYKGDAFCEAPPPGTYFRLSDGESVGLALSLSVIVLLVMMGLIFMCLKKTAEKQGNVAVLATNTKSVPQDDRL